MATETERDSVLEFLQAIISKTPDDQVNTKVYHPCGNYSWLDLAHEIESNSTVGQGYVNQLVEDAERDNVSLPDFLKPGKSVP